MDRVGSGGILARLADVLAATHHPLLGREWLRRRHRLDRGGQESRMSAVCWPPSTSQPDRDWTVEALARMMGASRSAFAERFATVVGETPAKYVPARAHAPGAAMAGPRQDEISVVAARLGYDSEASFSRAFKRVMGVAPSHLRHTGGSNSEP